MPAHRGIFMPIFTNGSELLLCERAAAERAVVRWELSDREKSIIQQLG